MDVGSLAKGRAEPHVAPRRVRDSKVKRLSGDVSPAMMLSTMSRSMLLKCCVTDAADVSRAVASWRLARSVARCCAAMACVERPRRAAAFARLVLLSCRCLMFLSAFTCGAASGGDERGGWRVSVHSVVVQTLDTDDSLERCTLDEGSGVVGGDARGVDRDEDGDGDGDER